MLEILVEVSELFHGRPEHHDLRHIPVGTGIAPVAVEEVAHLLSHFAAVFLINTDFPREESTTVLHLSN